MKKIHKMPTAFILEMLSVFIVLTGSVFAVFHFLWAGEGRFSPPVYVLALLGILTTAALVRMAGVIGQVLFDLNKKTHQLADEVSGLKKDTASLEHTLEQVSCDTRDINENIQRIASLFEKIEKHLDLK
ncbi:MAG: hypothetical protein PHH75_06135 [Candidatus Omnitrophica bacterium]|nr:hypothetical protein [Candidatus Omnitrophota bacterium]MDD5574741.1 hypothetical protein [Candidatus Omnitrophota bacterium]